MNAVSTSGHPREITDEGAYGLWTHQTKFCVRTMPHDDRLIIRVIPHITRFGGTAPVYIPRRSPDKPPTATVLLYTPRRGGAHRHRARTVPAGTCPGDRPRRRHELALDARNRPHRPLPAHSAPLPGSERGTQKTSAPTTGSVVMKLDRRTPSHFCCTAPATRTASTNQKSNRAAGPAATLPTPGCSRSTICFCSNKCRRCCLLYTSSLSSPFARSRSVARRVSKLPRQVLCTAWNWATQPPRYLRGRTPRPDRTTRLHPRQ